MQDQVRFTPAELRRMERFENTVLALGIVSIAVIAYGPTIITWFKGVF